METKKVYIYRFTTIPDLIKSYGGNLTIIEKTGKVGSDKFVDVEDYDYIHITNFDNIDCIFNESFNAGLCYDFFSFRDDRMLDFKLAIYAILQIKIDNRKNEINELEKLKDSLGNLVNEVVDYNIKHLKI